MPPRLRNPRHRDVLLPLDGRYPDDAVVVRETGSAQVRVATLVGFVGGAGRTGFLDIGAIGGYRRMRPEERVFVEGIDGRWQVNVEGIAWPADSREDAEALAAAIVRGVIADIELWSKEAGDAAPSYAHPTLGAQSYLVSMLGGDW